MEFQDITKTGTRGLKGLKGLEFNPDDTEAQVQAKIAERRRRLMETPPTPSSTTTRFSAPAYEAIGNRLVDSGFGESTYDAGAYLSELQDLNEHRAQEQPWYSKLGAGIAKGVALAGTTFLDGTVGLIAGAVTAIGEGRVSGIWDNEVSNSLSELNRELETALPNYMTKEEQENPWYKNLGTMNFWADSIIKNLGFTVGAFYSGGAWTKALKGIGWLKGAMGTKVVGSTLSAVNEGRIEANNTVYDVLKLQNREIDDMVERRREEILASDDTEAHKKANLKLLEQSANRLRQDAKEKADAVGLTTFIGNTILLSLDNYAQFGKLYARGFKNARGLSSGISKAAEEMAAEEAGKNVVKQGGKYAWKDITKKQALMKGLKNGLLEGNEEMAQAFIAETAGNMQSPDSPDAYYKALTDQNAQLKTKDFLTSITEGFVNTYGNGDRWEEFAVGAFTGLLGMPTFGKVNNSDANTYLGRGRSIGLSGGLFGEIRNANQQNREGREAVDVMNKYVDKMQNHARYFAQSQSFTDAMDGWAEADDAFEYKNAENNDDFAAISRFAQTGKLNDLKEMVNQSFENLSDDELANIAMHTSPNVKMGEDGTVETSNDDGSPATGGWRSTDGSLMSDTEEGRALMREELIKKRDKILSEIDKYEKSVETVRAIGNNSLTEDQVNELAWLNWKVKMFTDRYESIKVDEVLTDMQNSIQAFQRGRGRGMIDEESDEGKKLIKAMENTEEFINALRSAKTPLQLGALIEANPHLTDFLEDWAYPILEDVTGIDAATFEIAMTNLRDTTRIAKATRTFNQRYKEFKEDPIKLIKNRERIDKKKEKVNKASEDVNLKDKVNNSNVSDIVHGMENGDLDSSQLDGLFTDEDTEFLNQSVGQEGQPQQPTGKQKVEEAKKIIKTSQRMNDALDNLGDSSIDPQAVADARTLLKNSKDVSESEQEMLDTASQAYNDPAILYDEDDPSMQGISQEELESILSERIDTAKSVIEQAKAVLSEQNDELDDLPEGAPVKQRMGKEEVQPQTREDRTTGHDETSKTPTENERQKEVRAKKAQDRKVEGEQIKINDFFSGLKDEVPQGQVATFNKAVGEVLKGIDMLIKAKATPKQIGSTIKSTQSYQTAKQLAPNLDDYLNVYVTSKLKPKAEVTQAPSQEAKVSTPTVTEEEVKQATTAQMNSNPNQGEFTGTYQYWKPTLSYLPFGKAYQKGNTTPFYKLARTLTNGNGTPMYTEAQLRRIEAVGKYLDEHGAFKLVDSGAVKVGDDVKFSIDSSLNDAAGEIVILMTDSQGRVIGDVMSPTDSRFASQLGLPQFVDRVTKEYQDAGSPQHFTSKETTTVDKNMVGKIPYLADHQTMNTLNEVHSDGERPIPFKIGVAANSGQNARILATAGRTKKQGQSELERSINPPLSAKAGQPFLLVPTSSAVNHYMPVPFVMESYNPNTQNTALGRAIHKVLERIPASDNSNVMSIINALEELISVQEIHINYDGDNVKITIKPNGAEHQMTIYNGTKSAPNIVEQLELGLQGQPFQISRKYMNEDYEGQDYNRMIGEVARINLPIGTTHTVSDWFTIKPIGADGKSMKAKSPRSTGKNPYAAEVPEVVIQRGNMQLFVDPKTWTVSDGKKTYTGPNADKVKAQAFGVYTNQNMEKPYQTAWGYYDPKTDNFVEKPNKVLRTLGAPSTSPKQLTLTNPHTKTTYVVKVGETRRIDDGMYPGVSTITDIKDDGTIVDSYYDETSRETITREFSSERYLTELSYSTLVTSQGTSQTDTPAQLEEKAKKTDEFVEDAKKLYDRVSKTHPWLIDLMAVTKEFLENSNKRKETKESLMKRFKNRAIDEGRDIVSDNDLATLIDYVLGPIIENPATQSIQESETPAQLEEKAKKAGLLGNKVRQALWQILSPEQQTLIVNKKGPKQKQWMDALEGAFNASTNTFDEAKLKGTVDVFLGRKALYSRTDEYQEPYKLWNKERELQWLQKALPNLSTSDHLTLVDGLIRINDSSEPGFAYGKFQEGMITISNLAARGTSYHEAFHAVVHTLLNTDEYQKLFDAASERWSNVTNPLELEETLAEDFRKFMQSEEEWRDNLEEKGYGILRKTIATLFHNLKNRIKGLYGKTHYINKLYYNINRGKFARRKVGKSDVTRFPRESYTSEMQSIKDKAIANGTFMKAPNGNPTNLTERQWLQVRTKAFKEWFGDWEKYANVSSEVYNQLLLVFERIPKLNKIGSAREYAAYLADIFPSTVDKSIYWHGTNEDMSEGFKSAKKGKGSGAPETRLRNDFYLAKQAWSVLQYVNGVNRNSIDKNGFAHWNKLWWELKEIMSNGRRENNSWKDIVIGEKTVRQGIPNKKGVFNRDKGGENGKWLSERKADYGYKNKSDREFFENILGIQWGKDTFNTWTKRNAEIFKSLEKTHKGIYPAIINVQNPIREKGQNTYYEEERGLFTQAEKEGNDAILGASTDNEFGSDVAVVLNASEENIHFLGTKYDIEEFKNWLNKNRASKVVDENGEPLVVYHGSPKYFSEFRNKDGEGIHFFTTDRKYAERYSKDWLRRKGYMMPVFLNIRNPKRGVEKLEHLKAISIYNEEKSKRDGFDGIEGHDVKDILRSSNGTEYVVFKANQIKSATDNTGTFSTENDDIRYRMAKGFKGTIQEFQSMIDNLINNQSWSNKVSKNKELGRVLDYWETEGYKVNVKSRQNPYTKTKRLTVISVGRIISEEPTLYRRIEQYHADKMMYSNLSQDDKDYLTERGITPTEYSQMTQLEKEVLFRCKY